MRCKYKYLKKITNDLYESSNTCFDSQINDFKKKNNVREIKYQYQVFSSQKI